MKSYHTPHLLSTLLLVCITTFTSTALSNEVGDSQKLVAALLAQTPIIDDLRQLTDDIGGRPTGSLANERSVAWAIERFNAAGVTAKTQAFNMPKIWLEQNISASISGDVTYSTNVVGKIYSGLTQKQGINAPLVYAGQGTPEELANIGDKAKGALLFIETDVLDDQAGLGGLFAEYIGAGEFEPRAKQTGALGIVYMGSRPHELLYRHNAIPGPDNEHLMLVMAREDGLRTQRLLQAGKQLNMHVSLQADVRENIVSHNVIAEIKGSKRPDEIVLIGAHLDSHELGTGALDNGSNVTLMIDLARQIKRLGLQPERTIRFALWNGEEQGLYGSAAYAEAHRSDMAMHVMALSMDIGTGALQGFFTNGRGADVVSIIDSGLKSVAGFGPFTHPDVAISGTDHFDFFLHGIPALVGNQKDANYASNYHAASDTFDKVDLQQLKVNAAITASVTWAFANSTQTPSQLSRDQVQAIIEANDLQAQMEPFGVWDAWINGTRGLRQ